MGKPEDYERALIAKNHQVKKMGDHVGDLARHADDVKARNDQMSVVLDDLEAQKEELRKELGLPKPNADELERVLIAPDLLPSESELQAIRRRMPDLSLGLEVPAADGDWDAYVRDVDAYIDRHGIDLDRDPLDQLLPAGRAAELVRQFDEDYEPTPWDKLDWGVVGFTVLAGALLDYFLVATPGAAFKGEPQRGSPVTGWFREQSRALAPMSAADDLQRNSFQQWMAELTTKAEAWTKVPYDVVSPKRDLTPNTHRIASIGHDPVLGLVFGVKDILCRTCTFIDASGTWRVVPGNAYSERGILEALATVIVHGFSDVFTAKGLPPPFLPALQALKVNSGFAVRDGGEPVSVPNLIRYMYSNGYDLRHFATMAIVPAFAELTVRLYSALRVTARGEPLGKDGIRDRLKLSQMLTLTHGLLASGNIVKTALYGWNPTALNMAQFLALGKQMISLVKLSSERNALIRQDLDKGWEKLLAGSENLARLKEQRTGPAT